MIRTALVRLYPASWRTRYGDEFEALLEERGLGPYDVLDILLGALDARLRLRGSDRRTAHRKGFPMSLRLGGIAAAVGGALWIVAFALIAFADMSTGDPSTVVFIAAAVLLLVGMAGLSAFQARQHPGLVWAAFLLPAVGSLAALAGIVMMATADPTLPEGLGWGWLVLGIVGVILGSGLFAIVTYRTRALPRSGAIALGLTSLVSVAAFAGASGLAPVPEVVSLAIVAFAIGWIVLGLQAIAVDRRSVSAGPA